MSRLVMIEGVPHRWRRGKLAPIPSEWVGTTTHTQSIRKRASKQAGTSEKERTRTPRPAERAVLETDD